VKNLALYLHALWALVTGVLFFLVLSKPTTEANPLVATPTDQLPHIYYVNYDSLAKKSTYIQQLRDESEARQTNLSRELDRRVKQFQTEVADYQQKGASMSAIQRELKEQELSRKQQELVQYREDVADRLAKDEAGRADAMVDKIKTFLKQQQGLGNVAYVLAYTKQSNILLANDSLDITTRVIDGLNAQHTAEKEKAKK